MSSNTTSSGKENPAAQDWTSFAAKYEKGTGGATRVIAKHIVSISPPLSNTSLVLDNACGTGIVTQELQQHLSGTKDIKVRVIGADAAPGMVQTFQAKAKQAQESSDWPNIEVLGIHAVRAEDLDEKVVASDSITHAYMNFGIFFCQDPEAAARHIYRSLVPGGMAIVTFWADLGYLKAWQETMQACNPDNSSFKPPFADHWRDPAYIKDFFQRCGFAAENVNVTQEHSFFRAKDMDELADLQTTLFSMLVRGTDKWPMEETREQWKTLVKGHLAESASFVKDQDSVAIKMLANVAVCTK